MAVVINIPISNPATGFGYACVIEPERVVLPEPIERTDISLFSNICAYKEIVYANSESHNDVRSFISSVPVDNATIDFTLIKGNEEFDLDDDRFGTYYDFGDFPNQLRHKGYQLDFQKVYDELGYGIYSVRTTRTFLGTTEEKTSHLYKLEAYNPLTARNYIKIEVTQNANITGVFDYSGLEWYQALRVKGNINIADYELVNDNIMLSENENRELFLGANRVSEFQTISIYSVPSSIREYFGKQGSLNMMKVTNYNDSEHYQSDGNQYIVEGIEDVITSPNNPYADLKIKTRELRESSVRFRF